MNTKKKPAPLREQIIAFLAGRDEATLKQIAAATSERDFPSRVTTELNKMRTDAVVECEKKKGKNELWYWLATPAPAVRDSQPAVEQNTGSSAADASATPPAGAAVQPEPAPVAAASLPAASVAADETYSLLSVLADIRAVVGDPEGRLMQDELVERVRTFARAGAMANADLDRIREVLGQRIHIGDPEHLAAPVKCAALAAELIDSLLAANQENQNMIAVASETLAPLAGGDIDTADMELDELAEDVAARLAGKDLELLEQARLVVDLRTQLANQTALVAKLEHLLQSSRNEAEYLRKHTDHSAVTAEPVPLQALLKAVAALVPENTSVAVSGSDRLVTVKAFGCIDAEVDPSETEDVLGHIAALSRHIAIPF